jgi:hypothetical protein
MAWPPTRVVTGSDVCPCGVLHEGRTPLHGHAGWLEAEDPKALECDGPTKERTGTVSHMAKKTSLPAEEESYTLC